MKSILLLVALLTFLLAGTQVLAQDPGDIGIFFDAEGTQTTGSILPASPFTYNLYVVAFDVPGGISGYEGSLTFPPTSTLLSAIFEPAMAINVGTPEDWAVGTGICLDAVGPTLLISFLFLDTTPSDDMIFTLGPFSESSFDPPVIGYVGCDLILRPFGAAVQGGGYPDNSAVGNPTAIPPVATEEESWGGVKALYR